MRLIVLESGDSLRIKMDDAVVTDAPQFTSHFYTSLDTDIGEANGYGLLNGTSYVDLVPTVSEKTIVKEVSIFNDDTDSHTFQFEIWNGVNAYILFRTTVGSGNSVFLSGIIISLANSGVISVNGETGVVTLDLDEIIDVPPYPSDSYEYVLVENGGVLTWELYTSGGGGETLAETLVIGNVTGGTNLEVTNSDNIYFPDSIRTLFTFDGGYSAGKVAGVISWIVDGFSVATTGALNIFQALNSGIVKLGAAGLTSRLQLWNTSGNHVEHDVTNITDTRAFVYPDADVDFTGGSDGQVLTQQADGSWIPETPASGVTDHALLSNLEWESTGHTSYAPDSLAAFDDYGLAEEIPKDTFVFRQPPAQIVITPASGDLDYDLGFDTNGNLKQAFRATVGSATELQFPTFDTGSLPTDFATSYLIAVTFSADVDLTFVAGYFDGDTSLPTLSGLNGEMYHLYCTLTQNNSRIDVNVVQQI